MNLVNLTIENFRIFGRKLDGEHLDLRIRRGLTVLVGENDSGKTAIIDALRLVLGTTSQDYLRITEDDFHKGKGITAEDFTVYCRFEGLTDGEAARFLEWLSLEDGGPVLELTFRAFVDKRRNKSGAVRPFISANNRSGPNGQGKAVDGEIRTYLRLTYLKPLRDAEMEMAAGRGSRLSQLLYNHPRMLGQDELSELPPPEPGKPQMPPPTLRGMMNIAEKWVTESPVITEAKEQLNRDYLTNLSLEPDKLRGEISIGRSSDLKSILEKLELWLSQEGIAALRTRRGLGLNNVLFMAAELLLLSESTDTGLPLLLIEEPEAHLHPQLQLRLMEFLEEKTKSAEGVQVIVTTHSPNLSSKADIENITIMSRGKAYPLAGEYTKLTPSDYRYLRRFLDATKANLFFARGVVLVEGDAENILLPTIARHLGKSFSEYGVSIVNVGSRGLFRYGRIFQRLDGQDMPIRVACICDRDILPREAEGYVTRRGDGPRFENEFDDDSLSAHLTSLRKHDGGMVATFVSEKWTLEHDLALTAIGREIHSAIAIAKKLKNLDRDLTLEERVKLQQDAGAEHDRLTHENSLAKVAAIVYQPLYENKASKAQTAQVLAQLLDEANPTAEELRSKLPLYLVRAIDFVTSTPARAASTDAPSD